MSARAGWLITGALFLCGGACARGVSSALVGAAGHDLCELRACSFLVALLALTIGLRDLCHGLAVSHE
jgi:hypothetical protein